MPAQKRSPSIGSTAIFALTALVAAACTEGGEAGPALRIETVHLGELRDGLYPTLMDTVLAEPRDLEIADDRLYVTETNTSRVTVLDLDLDLVRRLGRRGKGPGELTFPVATRVAGARVSVADEGTGRFEFFDTAGTPSGSLPRGSSDEHVLLGGGRVLAIDRDPGALGTLIEPGRVERVGVVPDSVAAGGGRPFFDQLHRGTLGGDSVLLHIPESTGVLRILRFDGTLIETRGIPEHIAAEIVTEKERIASAFGGAILGSAFVKGFSVSSDGRFVTVAAGSATAPVLIHDLDGRRLLLVDVSQHIHAGKVQSAKVAVYDNGLLYVLAGASLFVFELTLPD
jgi:hypothetical protein